MARWLSALAGPGWPSALLNDAWEGPPVSAGCSAGSGRSRCQSGYVILRSGQDQAVLDVGPVAPPHLPPHAHADVLSFVLWADGRLVVADPGAFSYGGADRLRFRGTAAHSTVQVDGHDQCDFWGPFRAAHMPRVRRGLEHNEDIRVITAEHDGYRRLPDPVTHRRTFVWLPGDGLVVVDRLLARCTHRVSTRIRLAPGIQTQGERAGPFEVLALGAGTPSTVEAGSYAPFLGREVSASVVRRDLACRSGGVVRLGARPPRRRRGPQRGPATDRATRACASRAHAGVMRLSVVTGGAASRRRAGRARRARRRRSRPAPPARLSLGAPGCRIAAATARGTRSLGLGEGCGGVGRPSLTWFACVREGAQPLDIPAAAGAPPPDALSEQRGGSRDR